MPSTATSKTAILVFANSAKEEAKKKAIANGSDLYDALTEHTLAQAQKSNLPYFHFTETQQVGTTFGERFSNAIATVFQLGFENIITIGNDTPQLTAYHLTETRRQLEAGNTVLGPSVDGGFYLLGLQRSNFQQETFKHLPWQRFSLFHKISDFLATTNCSVFKLPTLRDLDTIHDIRMLSGYIKSIKTSVLEEIVLFLKNLSFTNTCIQVWFTSIISRIHFNKGSPVLFLS